MKIYRYVLLLSCLGILFGQDAKACKLAIKLCPDIRDCHQKTDTTLYLYLSCPFDFSVLAKKAFGRKKLFQRLQSQQDQIIQLNQQIPNIKQSIKTKGLMIQKKLLGPDPNPPEIRALMQEKLALESQLQSLSFSFVELNKEINRLPDNEIKILWQQQQHCLKQLNPTLASPDRELCIVK